MSDTVTTTLGELPRDELDFRDLTHEDATAIYTTRQWFHRGEQVRQDAWVDLKRGHDAALKGN